MRDKHFNFGFVAAFLVVIVILFYFFSKYSGENMGESSLTTFWAALTVLILLFGIISVSMYLNHMRNRKIE